MGILDIVLSILGVIIVLAVIVTIIARVVQIIPIIFGFTMPAVFAIIGPTRIADYFGVSSEFIMLLIFGLFVGGTLLSFADSTIISAVGAGGVCSGLLLTGLMMMRFLPPDILLYLAGNAMSILAIFFVPLLVIMIFMYSLFG
ncbi:MAG: hypothetical protein IJ366_01115 [Clostridia bacterium]|nr:hypothetical protein [Clostridia bacterium]